MVTGVRKERERDKIEGNDVKKRETSQEQELVVETENEIFRQTPQSSYKITRDILSALLAKCFLLKFLFFKNLNLQHFAIKLNSIL